MTDVNPIDRLRVDNVGGAYYLEICDSTLVPDYKIVNRVVTTDLQSNLANWKRLVFTKNTLSFKEQIDIIGGIEFYTTEITAVIPRDRPDVLANFKKLRSARFVGILKNRNGDKVVIGGNKHPLIFQLKSRDFKTKVNQRNEYSVRFFIKKTYPSPFYLPEIAGEAYWINGEPMQWQNGQFIHL